MAWQKANNLATSSMKLEYVAAAHCRVDEMLTQTLLLDSYSFKIIQQGQVEWLNDNDYFNPHGAQDEALSLKLKLKQVKFKFRSGGDFVNSFHLCLSLSVGAYGCILGEWSIHVSCLDICLSSWAFLCLLCNLIPLIILDSYSLHYIRLIVVWQILSEKLGKFFGGSIWREYLEKDQEGNNSPEIETLPLFPIHGGSHRDFFGVKASDLSLDHSVLRGWPSLT
ncbi:hypothetical protein Tco_0089984 [Tanacetum coccineum]